MWRARIHSLIARALITLALLESAWLAYPIVRRHVLAVEDTPAARGRRVAAALGCFGCHGPEGNGGVRNPGSEEGTVPAFTGQTQMMFVKGAGDLREYVLDGAPRRKREDPDYRARMEAAAHRMPAFRSYVDGGDLEDLVAYLRAASGQVVPDEPRAARGAELAADLGCFGCHGPLGAGGFPNPGSLKGYVPGFWGKDFDDLVRGDDELREWIAEGGSRRLREHPVGSFFIQRQAIKMAAYGRFLAEDDVGALAAYVRWVHAGSWQPLSR